MNGAELDTLLDHVAERIARRLLELQSLQPPPTVDGSPWMSIDTAAAYLDLPKQRLYKLTAQGAIPHYKQDGRLLFNRQELDQWMDSFRQSSDWIFAGKRAISP
jgi:excisionase family DNA binding protein